MRRILLVLTFMSFAAWSQPAQQQAQAPIAVKVETPPPPPKTLPNYLQQFGPLLAACVAVGVAFMQRYLFTKEKLGVLHLVYGVKELRPVGRILRSLMNNSVYVRTQVPIDVPTLFKEVLLQLLLL